VPPKGDASTVLVLDVGMTNCKAVLFTLDGLIKARSAVPYPTYRPGPGLVEQLPTDWWAAAQQACIELWAGGESPRSVLCVGTTAHMHALVDIGSNGEPLGPAMALGDHRALEDAAAITRKVGRSAVYSLTGATLDPSMPAAKISWLRRAEPDRWHRAWQYLSCRDYLVYMLTGQTLTEPIDACATSLYDIGARIWSSELLEAAGVNAGQLPAVVRADSIAGPLLPNPARELGLLSGIPVIVGAGDDIEVLGNGLIRPGQRLEHLGTTGSILAVVDRALYDPGEALELYPHTIDGLWVLGGSTTAAGAALEWASTALGYSSVEEAALCLKGALPGTEDALFLPHLAGARCPSRDPLARGAWVGLGPNLERDSLMRSAFEGVALSVQAILDRTELITGRGGEISVSGGDAAADPWLRLRAEVYQRPMAPVECPEPTALGVAILAMKSLGVFRDIESAVAGVVHHGQALVPSAVGQETVGPRREAYAAAYNGLKEVWPLLAGARHGFHVRERALG
jgi:xylulokinase